ATSRGARHRWRQRRHLAGGAAAARRPDRRRDRGPPAGAPVQAAAELRRRRAGDDGRPRAADVRRRPRRVHVDPGQRRGGRPGRDDGAHAGRGGAALLDARALPRSGGGLGRDTGAAAGVRRRVGGLHLRAGEHAAGVATADVAAGRVGALHRAAGAGVVRAHGAQAAAHGVRPLAPGRRPARSRRPAAPACCDRDRCAGGGRGPRSGLRGLRHRGAAREPDGERGVGRARRDGRVADRTPGPGGRRLRPRRAALPGTGLDRRRWPRRRPDARPGRRRSVHAALPPLGVDLGDRRRGGPRHPSVGWWPAEAGRHPQRQPRRRPQGEAAAAVRRLHGHAHHREPAAADARRGRPRGPGEPVRAVPRPVHPAPLDLVLRPVRPAAGLLASHPPRKGL
ncbi:MAG: Sulfide:quinone oxidoreductase, Type II, partial [uncultured Blastococcus sp.]